MNFNNGSFVFHLRIVLKCSAVSICTVDMLLQLMCINISIGTGTNHNVCDECVLMIFCLYKSGRS